MKRLLKNLRPNEIYLSVHQIDYEHLWRAGYRALVFDIDNTLGAWGCVEIDKQVRYLLNNLSSRGFALGFLSNDMGENRSVLKEQLSAWPLVWDAHKPSTRGYNRIIKLLQGTKEQTVMVGDQLFTDIWGARRAGVYAILVAPVSPQTDSVWAKLRRPIERWVICLFTGKNAAHKDADQRQKKY